MDLDEVQQLKESLAKEKRLRLEFEAAYESQKQMLENEKRLRLDVETACESQKQMLENEKRLYESQKQMLENEQRLRLEAESKLNCLKYLTFKSQSYAQIFTNYCKDGTSTDCEDLGLPQVNHTELVNAWNEIITGMSEFEEGKDERAQVHPIIKMALGSIIKKLSLSKIKFHYESRLQNPCLCPDFSITSSQIAEPAWSDCLSFIECKSTDIPVSEGGGQAISYLTHLSIPDTLDLSGIRDLNFSAQTNGRIIQFFLFKKEKSACKNYYTPELNLFEAENEIGIPSKGFELLCRFMTFLENSSISTDILRINGKYYKIIKTYQKCEAIIVGLINLGDEGLGVAKYAINQNKPAMFAIRKEALIYKILKNSPVKTLRLSIQSNFNHLVFLDVGKGDLRSWSYPFLHDKQQDQDVEDNFQKIIRCFIGVFDQIKALHDFGFTHCDIRPANILILNDDTPCLIDFVTVTKHETKLDWQQGTLLYMAEDLLRQEKPYFYKAKYDMESLFYSFLDSSDLHYSNSFLKSCVEIKAENIDPDFNNYKFADSRKTRLDDLRASKEPSNFSNSKFVDLFFSLYDKLAEIPDDLDNKNYYELRQILESFLSSELDVIN